MMSIFDATLYDINLSVVLISLNPTLKWMTLSIAMTFNLSDLALGNIFGVAGTDSLPLMVNTEHDLRSLLLSFTEVAAEQINNKLHGRIVII